jgi:hypothetical protein
VHTLYCNLKLPFPGVARFAEQEGQPDSFLDTKHTKLHTESIQSLEPLLQASRRQQEIQFEQPILTGDLSKGAIHQRIGSASQESSLVALKSTCIKIATSSDSSATLLSIFSLHPTPWASMFPATYRLPRPAFSLLHRTSKTVDKVPP